MEKSLKGSKGGCVHQTVNSNVHVSFYRGVQRKNNWQTLSNYIFLFFWKDVMGRWGWGWDVPTTFWYKTTLGQEVTIKIAFLWRHLMGETNDRSISIVWGFSKYIYSVHRYSILVYLVFLLNELWPVRFLYIFCVYGFYYFKKDCQLATECLYFVSRFGQKCLLNKQR